MIFGQDASRSSGLLVIVALTPHHRTAARGAWPGYDELTVAEVEAALADGDEQHTKTSLTEMEMARSSSTRPSC
jgi:hypothetical protein